ncbi:MAG TPA: hypothetical protein VGD65_20645 [Chryseosolibacter sp.]
MKRVKGIVLIVFMVALGCADDNLVFENQRMLIGKKWIAEHTRADGMPTDLFKGMILGFSPNTYTTNLTDNEVWPAFGEYTWEGSGSRILVRDDNNELFIATLDESQLILVFKFIDANVANARSAPVEYTFVFKAQADSD